MNVLEVEKNPDYYRSVFFLGETDLQTIREAGELIQDQQTQIFENLYEWMHNQPYYSRYYTEEVFAAIQASEGTFWKDAVSGLIDEDFIERQKFFGVIFAETGIPYEAYMGFMHYYYRLVLDTLAVLGYDSPTLIRAFKNLIMLIMSIVNEGYHAASHEVVRKKSEALQAMSTPIAQLWDGIILLPIVGFIDSMRASSMMNEVLHYVAKEQSKILILDIRGVAAMDTAVANYLLKIVKAVRLMGCTAFLSGISPSVAETIVDLGVDIGELHTGSSMQDVLAQALRLRGLAVAQQAGGKFVASAALAYA